MALMVPPVTTCVTQPMSTRVSNPHVGPTLSPPNATTVEPAANSFYVRFDVNRQELMFEDGQSSLVKHGDWIVITTTASKYKVNYGNAICRYPLRRD
jgi:hypothetical protein